MLAVAEAGAPLITRNQATGAVDVGMHAGPARARTTPLHVAAMCAAPDAVRALLAGSASLTATGPRNMTALHAAIESGSARAAQRLVAATPRGVALQRWSRLRDSGWRSARATPRRGAHALRHGGGRGSASERDRSAAAGRRREATVVVR